MSTENDEAPILSMGGQLFTLVLCAETHPPDEEALEDQAISAAKTDEEADELLTLAEDVAAEAEDAGDTELVNAVMTLRADDPRHAEQLAHRALQAVFDEAGTAFIRIVTMGIFPGNVPTIALPDPHMTLAADLANPGFMAELEELPCILDASV